MSEPATDSLSPSHLPRPPHDTGYERGLVSAYFEERPDYHIHRRRGTPTAYLTYTVTGKGFFRDAADRVLYVSSGDVALIQPRVYQEYGTAPAAEEWRFHWVHFDVQPDWTPWVPLGQTSALTGTSQAHVAGRASRDQISDLFFELHDEHARPESWRVASCLNLLERILILVHAGSEGHASRPEDPRVWKVLRFLESEAPRLPSPGELRKVAGLSHSRLASVFKRQTGVSILGAVNRLRLRAAQFALLDASVSVSDAADRAGFQSAGAFSNWFLKQTGLRPACYRRKWLQRH